MSLSIHIRLTIDNTLLEVEEYIKTLSPEKYIVAKESVPRTHYHCACFVNKPALTQYVTRDMNKKIKAHFKITELRKVSISLDKGKSEIYCLKDGEFVTHGYSDAELEALETQSYSKLSKKKRRQLIDTEYLEGKLTWKAYTRKYITQMVDDNTQVSTYRLESHFNLVSLQKSPHKIRLYARQFDHLDEKWCV